MEQGLFEAPLVWCMFCWMANIQPALQLCWLEPGYTWTYHPSPYPNSVRRTPSQTPPEPIDHQLLLDKMFDGK